MYMGTHGLQRKLDEVEKLFHIELLRGLSEASQNAASQFFRSEQHNSCEVMKGRTDSLTNDLLEQAKEIMHLRKKLGEWPEKSVAAKFINYCERFNDVSNPHRFGVQKHAQALMDEIGD
jgi:hypothetical protein